MSVIPIRQGCAPAIASGTADPDVVKELEEMLDRARVGDITGLACVTLHPGDLTVYQRCGRLTRGVIGALVLLQHDMCKTDIEAP